MSEKMENTLRDCQLASLGKMLAGYTHELKNHLAIINESSGLMGDLLDMTEGEDEQTRKRFKKIIATIGERISQANIMARHLSSFAHRMDMPLSVFNVNDGLDEEITLIERFARLKSILLKKNLQQELPSIYSNPSLFQFVVFAEIHKIVDRCENGGEIIVSSSQQDQDVVVSLEGIGLYGEWQDKSSLQMSEAVNYAVKKMDISLNVEEFENRQKITLTLPAV